MYKDIKFNKYESIFNLYEKYKSMFRFAVVGCINTGVDFLTFTILYSLFGIDKLLCQAGGYGMGIVNSFVINKLWTFQSKEPNNNTAVQFIKFLCTNIISLGISVAGLNFLGRFNMNVYGAKIVVTVFLQVFNYLAYKKVVFRKSISLDEL